MAGIDLGYVPRNWQRDVHLALHDKRWGVLVCHRRAGKTVLAVMHLIHRACKCEKPAGRFAYIAPFLKQAKDNAWRYLKEYASKIPGTQVHESELRVTLSNGATIRLYGADNPDALRGIYLDGVFIDEVAQISKELWDSVLRPALSDRLGWAVLMGTPKGVNLLSEVYFKERENPDWYAAIFTVDQTNSLDAKEVAELRNGGITAKAFAREYLCDFSAAVDNVLISFEQAEAATKRHFAPTDYQFAARILGVDVARQGDDRSCVFPRQGLLAGKPLIWRNLDAMNLAAQITLIDDEYQSDAIFVDGSGGYGAGVIDRLRQLGRSVIEVQFGGKPDDDRYANKRSEMWFRMAEWIKNHGLIPNIQELKQDLCGPTYGHDARDKLMLEAKDKIKTRGLPSPDLGDALALTFAYPVHLRHDRASLIGRDSPALSDYDPVAAYLEEFK